MKVLAMTCMHLVIARRNDEAIHGLLCRNTLAVPEQTSAWIATRL